MSVPLDNLYHWVEGMLPAPAVLYLFYPYGSKNISDFGQFKVSDPYSVYKFPAIIAHDQEPLDWALYNEPTQYLNLDRLKTRYTTAPRISLLETYSKHNLKALTLADQSFMYDNAILIHSERNSQDLSLYEQNGFLCVHYWAHAVIARDWYRFAERDARLNSCTVRQHKFLIYCRDWSYRREYRLKFLEMVANANLDSSCQVSVMHTNSNNTHFLQHQFINPKFELSDPELINRIPTNTFSSTASADYNPEDFVNSEISVVLETVFDDSRIHLTEKTLRPIACGHPFILAAGPCALEYVRSYGFKTFAPWIDESYDLETDSFRRMEKIIESMTKIQNLTGQELETFSQEIKKIADFNKQHFFSKEFTNIVESELKTNLNSAFSAVKKTKGKHYMAMLKLFKSQDYEVQQRQEKSLFLRRLRQSCQPDQTSPWEDPAV